MKVVVNGEPRVIDDGTTVHTLAVAVLDRPKGVAVAVNGEVVAAQRVGDDSAARRRLC